MKYLDVTIGGQRFVPTDFRKDEILKVFCELAGDVRTHLEKTTGTPLSTDCFCNTPSALNNLTFQWDKSVLNFFREAIELHIANEKHLLNVIHLESK